MPQGRPKSPQDLILPPPRAPKAPFWSPRVAHRAPRLTKRHPKSSILSLFGTLGHTFAPKPLFSQLCTSKMASKGRFSLMFLALWVVFMIFVAKMFSRFRISPKTFLTNANRGEGGVIHGGGREGDKSPSQVRGFRRKKGSMEEGRKKPSKRLAHGTWAGGLVKTSDNLS